MWVWLLFTAFVDTAASAEIGLKKYSEYSENQTFGCRYGKSDLLLGTTQRFACKNRALVNARYQINPLGLRIF